MFQSISLLLRTSGGALGDCSLWKAVTHNLEWLLQPPRQGLLTLRCFLLRAAEWEEGGPLGRNEHLWNGEWNKDTRPYVAIIPGFWLNRVASRFLDADCCCEVRRYSIWVVPVPTTSTLKYLNKYWNFFHEIVTRQSLSPQDELNWLCRSLYLRFCTTMRLTLGTGTEI